MGRSDIESSCRDCEICTTSSAARGARELGKKSLDVMTIGISAGVRAFTKRCRLCGHAMKNHEDNKK